MVKRSKSDLLLEEAITKALLELEKHDRGSEKYLNILAGLEKLYAMQNVKGERKLKPDTVALVAANILGIVVILGFEQANVITSKALGFVFKGRV